MRKNILMMLLVFFLNVSAAFAQAKQENSEQSRSEATPVIPTRYSDALSCGPVLRVRYQSSSSHSTSGGNNDFARRGWSWGAFCGVRIHFLRVGFYAARYYGDIDITHSQERSDPKWDVTMFAPAKGLDIGGSLGAAAGKFDFGVKLDMLDTQVGQVRLDKLDLNLNNVQVDLTDFAVSHVKVGGKILSYELGGYLNMRIGAGFTVLFGGEWERVKINGDITPDEAAAGILALANVDPVKAVEKLRKPINIFYMMPGLRFCQSNFCFSGVAFLGDFGQVDTSWGGELGMELRMW